MLLAGLLSTSVLSPLGFAMTLRKSLASGDVGRVEKLVEFTALGSCLGLRPSELTPSILVAAFTHAPETVSKNHLPLIPQSIFESSISSLKYRGISVAVLLLSDGTTMEMERTGVWGWRLFCVHSPGES